jgi:hypothetical protein
MNDSKRRGAFRRVWFKVFPPAPVYRERQGWYW